MLRVYYMNYVKNCDNEHKNWVTAPSLEQAYSLARKNTCKQKFFYENLYRCFGNTNKELSNFNWGEQIDKSYYKIICEHIFKFVNFFFLLQKTQSVGWVMQQTLASETSWISARKWEKAQETKNF